jgi:hypothetical protein
VPAFDDLAEKWGLRNPAVIRLWDNAWNEFIPLLDYAETRRVIYSTNAIESLKPLTAGRSSPGHSRLRAGCPDMPVSGTRSLNPTGVGKAGKHR